MDNSIRTTQKDNRSTLNTATNKPVFKKGDSVLYPSVGNDTYKLIYDSDNGCLGFVFDGGIYHYGSDGKADVGYHNLVPSLFHDTPANRQAISILYSSAHSTQSCQRKIIDLTIPHDDEVILMPSIMLSDIACDIDGANRNLDSVGHLLYLIYQRQITAQQIIAMARLAHDSVDTWKAILCSQLDDLNKPLAQTNFGKMEVAL
ncbi:hypothetical protein [Psychrobacter sp. LV10R520-6]|uniref:hypothetical protein n=1 Tax=Psychrobacter sp. LV10R520-6 TaxID=1415574 RepID=UPI0024C6DFB1|nr:hypothetical protein [Psychrobacter sp. LV10R520-6]SNT69842.1 hypothetical protein SAMN04488491_0952 [Psychrobacter sp. LV10R520-6]